jgi:hypothetical protein
MNPIRVDFYEGAYGPTIRIDVKDAVMLHRLRGVFLMLTESADHIELAQFDFIAMTGINGITLKRVSPQMEPPKN